MDNNFPDMFDPEKVARIFAAERMNADLLQEFDKAEKCGLNCKEFRKQHRRDAEFLRAVREQYGITNPIEPAR